jgi:hypothetical protein
MGGVEMINRRVALAVAVFFLLALSPPAMAQQGIIVLDESREVIFRDKAVFTISVEGPAEINEATLLYRIVGQPVTSRGEAEFQPGKKIEASWEWNLRRDYMPPGTEVEYWWRIKDAAGGKLKTEEQTFTYLDDRYDWQELSTDKIGLYWYRGDEQFGQGLFERAVETLDLLSESAGIEVENKVKVFIYGSHDDLMGAIAEGSHEWTGGQAFTEFGIVVIGVSPGQLGWGKRATVHELTHLVVHQATDNPYGDLPTWLDEGLAMKSEGDLEVVFQMALEDAIRTDTLISVRSISSNFPADPDQATLAYAESYSLVDFIQNELGRDKTAKLIDIFAEGATYDDALIEALGMDTNGLEDVWRAHIGAEPRPGAPAQAATATPSSAPAEGETPIPRPTEQTPTPIPPGQSLPCTCGLLPGLALLVFFAAFRPR